MKNGMKRILSLVLALCLCLSMLPAVTIQAEAASITVFSQYDSRWKNHQYGYKDPGVPATIGSGGCGILSLVNAVYYMNGNFIDPIALADWSVNNNHRKTGVGTKHSLYPAYSKAYGSTYGFSCTSSEGTSSWDVLTSHLQNGGAAIVPTVTRATGSQHLLVIADFDSSNGKYLVLDSSASSNRGTSSGYAWMTKATFLDRMSCSKFILINNTSGSSGGHTTHTYTGSYHEAAHPHKVYQKCSCGATQYTGATTTVSTCETCNPVNTTDKYNAVLPFKAYLKGTSTVYPHATAQLASTTGGEIWSTDECTITAVYSNGACKVTYPAGTKTKTAYTKLSNFVDNTSAALTKQTVNHKVITYIRASTGSTQYGYISAGDVIYKLGTSGNMTQVFYPTSSGYKLAWVETGKLPEPVPIANDTKFNPYCPIKGYPCATATFNAYAADHTTDIGDIWVTDYCTIKAVYADGWCQVTYPTGSGDKTGYTQLSNFVYNISADHAKYTANAQIKVHKDKNLPGDMNWYIGSGDQFFVVGNYGSTSQVLYPIDAQYGGGYKLGWIRTADLPKTTYAVSYNANGGNGAPSNQTKTHGAALTLSTTAPTRAGYTFVGWATSASATSATYAPGASYATDANLSLYAVWKLNKYEITYDANGGTNAPAVQNKTHGTNLTLSADIPAKHYTVTFDANEGTVDTVSRQVTCEFLGWATSASASSAAYKPGSTFTMDANTTLYAVWKDATLAQYGIPVRDGYVFDGWYTAANGGTQVTISTTVSSNTTVYAHWVVATYGINYDANGGTGEPEAQTKTHGKNLTLSTSVPTREGHTFLGWATEENPDTVRYQPGDVYTSDIDIMLIAVWEQIALSKIEVKNGPTKTSYYVGDTLDPTGLVLTLVNNNGSTETVSEGFSCDPTTLNTAGTQTITVSYGGKTATFTVDVLSVKITSVEIQTLPNKLVYNTGEKLDHSGLVLLVNHNNGSTVTVTEGFTCDPAELSTAGIQKITVKYEEFTDTFEVEVKEAPAGKMTVASAEGKPGENITVALRIDENPGVIAARLKLAYDANVLTLTEVKDGGILGEHIFGNDKTANPYVLIWENGLAASDYTATGEFAYLTFKIADDAPEGSYELNVSYNAEEVYNYALQNVSFDITQGSVMVAEPAVCDHEMSDWETLYAATCTAEGKEHRVCSLCGYEETRILPIGIHKYTEQVTSPTCTENGYTTYTCECGESYTDNGVAALGHDMGQWQVSKEATCIAKGEEISVCSRCDHKETRETALAEHKWDAGVVAEDKKTITYTCQTEGCGKTKSVPVDHEHSYTEKVTAPTCTEKGYTTYTCECGESYTGNEVAALGHDMSQWQVSKEATCIVKGEEISVCSRCDHKEARETALTEHKWDAGVVAEDKKTVTYTCQTEGCGETKSVPVDHKHSYTEKVTAPTCMENGYTTYTCECGESYTGNEVAALGHDMGQWQVSKEATCIAKGEEISVCSRCDHKETRETAFAEHKWDAGVVAEDQKTTIYTCQTEGCGETKSVSVDHEHSYTETVTAPTCTEQGYTTHICACGDTYTDSETKALGHTEVVDSAVDATCTTSGLAEGKHCSVCGTVLVKQEEIKAIGHDWLDGACRVCGKKDPDWESEKEGKILRLAGNNRFLTAIMAADAMKENLGITRFDAVIVASGTNFADALSGSYLAAVKNAPILLSCNEDFNPNLVDKYNTIVLDYIKENLSVDGVVYILGGPKAVAPVLDEQLDSYRVKRLAGANRYETNIRILEEAGVDGKDILVCNGEGFADSLSASAAKRPILLVNSAYGIFNVQKPFLESCKEDFCIIGGEGAVSLAVEMEMNAYGDVQRIGGKNRFETSVAIAETFFDTPESAVLAYAWNFPDGLCGGALAATIDAPLILTMDKYEARATEYIQNKTIKNGFILGGEALISQDTVNTIFK